METQEPTIFEELRKAKLNAVRALGEICIAVGVPVETQALAAKALLEFKLETIRQKPLPVKNEPE